MPVPYVSPYGYASGRGCGCNGACHCNRLESTAITADGGTFQITYIPAQTLVNDKFYTLEVCQALPARTGIEPVALSDGTTAYPVITSNGNPVVSGMLRPHRKYRVRYGNGGTLSTGTIAPHFTVYDGLCPVEYSSSATLEIPE